MYRRKTEGGILRRPSTVPSNNHTIYYWLPLDSLHLSMNYLLNSIATRTSSMLTDGSTPLMDPVFLFLFAARLIPHAAHHYEDAFVSSCFPTLPTTSCKRTFTTCILLLFLFLLCGPSEVRRRCAPNVHYFDIEARSCSSLARW